MSAEMELAQRKIYELEQQIRRLINADEQLQLLPNGDLHRGIRLENSAKSNIDTEVIPESFGNPLNRALSQILKAAKGGHALTCLWCGLQYDGQNSEKDIREHLKKDHATVVEGHDQVVPELLMANLAEAQERLKAAGA